MITKRKGNKGVHRHLYIYNDSTVHVITIKGINKKQQRRVTKFSKKYDSLDTWYDYNNSNNGNMKQEFLESFIQIKDY